MKRLDAYELKHGPLFARVVTFIEEKILPIVLRHAISGTAHINTEEKLLDDPPSLATNLRTYLNGFSENMREVLDKFDFPNTDRKSVV